LTDVPWALQFLACVSFGGGAVASARFRRPVRFPLLAGLCLFLSVALSAHGNPQYHIAPLAMLAGFPVGIALVGPAIVKRSTEG
jgi:hypothetical protein